MALSLRSRVCLVAAALLVGAPLLAVSLPKPPPPVNHGKYVGKATVKVTNKPKGKPAKVVSLRKNIANEVTVNGAGMIAHASIGSNYGFSIQAAGVISHTAKQSKGSFLGTSSVAGSPPKTIPYKGAGTATYKTNSLGKRVVSFTFTGKRVNKPAEVVSYVGKGVR